jgi:hypothetical protein
VREAQIIRFAGQWGFLPTPLSYRIDFVSLYVICRDWHCELRIEVLVVIDATLRRLDAVLDQIVFAMARREQAFPTIYR